MSQFISVLLFNPTLINWPDFFGWIFLTGLIGLAFWAYRTSIDARNIRWEKRNWLSFAGLVVLTILGNLFLGVHIKGSAFMSWPGVPFETPGPALMFFSALPWLLAGGTLGPIPAFALGLLAGILRAPLIRIPYTPRCNMV